jgi:hypothetical protein
MQTHTKMNFVIVGLGSEMFNASMMDASNTRLLVLLALFLNITITLSIGH